LPPTPPPVGVTPLEAEADILKNDSESHRGPHWRFFSGLDSARPARPPLSVFLSVSLSLSLFLSRARARTCDKKGRKLIRGKRRGDKRVCDCRGSIPSGTADFFRSIEIDRGEMITPHRSIDHRDALQKYPRIGATADISLPRFLEISTASGSCERAGALLYSTLIYMKRYRRGGAENL